MEQRIVALAAISSTLLVLLFLILKYTAGIVALTTPPTQPPSSLPRTNGVWVGMYVRAFGTFGVSYF